jgi:hypothetical protein
LSKQSIGALLFSVALGCARTDIIDPTSPRTLEPVQHKLSHVEEGPQDAPEGVPESMRFPTFLHEVQADAGYVEGDSTAYAQAIVSYFGTNGLARATVSPPVGSPSVAEQEESEAFPSDGDVMATASLRIGPCVGTIHGTAYGRVWNQFPFYASFLTWGTKAKTSYKAYVCPEDPRPPSKSGGEDGEEEPSVVTCFTLVIDFYVLDLNTLTIVRVGSEIRRWCERDEDEL